MQRPQPHVGPAAKVPPKGLRHRQFCSLALMTVLIAVAPGCKNTPLQKGSGSQAGEGLGEDGARPQTQEITARAVTAALDWLAAHQDDTGRWDANEFMKHDSVDGRMTR